MLRDTPVQVFGPAHIGAIATLASAAEDVGVATHDVLQLAPVPYRKANAAVRRSRDTGQPAYHKAHVAAEPT
jgi:hypothetical protein